MCYTCTTPVVRKPWDCLRAPATKAPIGSGVVTFSDKSKLNIVNFCRGPRTGQKQVTLSMNTSYPAHKVDAWKFNRAEIGEMIELLTELKTQL